MDLRSIYRRAVWCTLFFFFAMCAFAQQLTVKGVVTDSKGETVIGASVLVEGTTNGSITDLDGAFEISNVSPKAVLVVSYIGYKTQKLPVNGKTTFKVVLAEDTEVLDEVVVVGYGVQRKSDLTGSVASVKTSDALKTTPTGNISDALQGRMAGVSVLSGSGDPSSDNTIRVRGVNSISGEGGPLVVIDGFIGGSLKTLNPADIQSIEVLKDASATAVYGSRGANGVILVTTKTPNKDRLTVSFNAFANFKTVAEYPDVLSPYEYAQLANAYGKEYNESQGKPAVQYYSEEQLEAFKNGQAGYDYIHNIFRDPAIDQNYELSISGGGEKTTFLASLRYQGNEGVIKASDNNLYSWRLKVDTKIKKWLKLGVNMYGYYNESSKPRITQYDGLIQQAMYFPTTVEPKDENGNYNNAFPLSGNPTYNPMGFIWESNNSNKTLNNRIQGYVEFQILDGLTFRSQLGVDFTNKLNTSVENNSSYYEFKNNKNQAKVVNYWNTSWLNTNTLSYVKEFNADHRINATAVFEQSYDDVYNNNGEAYQLSFPDLLGVNALNYSQSDLMRVASDKTIGTLMSGMLRVNYVFKNRYMLTASIRADGSSRLVNKWAYFPSMALAWDIKQEKFLENVNFINQMKLRLGYGSVGNQAVEIYRTYSKMASSVMWNGGTAYSFDRPKADDLEWERNEQFNVGLDFSVLKGRLAFNVDWYNKLSKNVLFEVEQPSHMGFSSLLTNSGEIRNRGIEITVSADPIATKDFSWHTDITLSHNEGIFTKIPTQTHRQQQSGQFQNQLFQMIEGEKLGTFWGMYSAGVWQKEEANASFVDAAGQYKLDASGQPMTNADVYKIKPGSAKYVDLNKDGVLNDEDYGIIGCGQPTFNWGWNNSFNYKDFDLSLFIVGFHGFDIYNATDQMGYGTISGQNMEVVTPKRELLNRWTETNTNTDVPGFVKADGDMKVFNSRFVEKGSFVKVKSITLGYSLPERICKNLFISNLRVYASVQNPFIFTKYSGMDPEATLGDPLVQGVDWGSYPNSRNYMIGLNFAF